MDGLSFLQSLKLLLVPGYIYGIGYLISGFFLRRRDFVFSVFASITFWCLIGWFSFGYLKYIVYFFSFIGLIGFILGFKDFLNQKMVLLAFIAVIVFRYFLIFPLNFPYGNDSIMHTYTTHTIINNGGFGRIIEPFGIEGFGNINLGFHFVAAGIHYLTNFEVIDSVIFTSYIFWGLYFLSLYHWLRDLRWAFIIAFITVRPSTFMAWVGFPTLASMAFSIFAFGLNPKLSIPFWTGALSTHFITSIPALLVYGFIHRKSIFKFHFILPAAGAIILLVPQYYHLIINNLSLQPYENRILNEFVVTTFPKSLLFALIYMILAFVGYDSELRERIPIFAVIIPILIGIISFLFALFDLKPHYIKAFYMARLYVPLIIPAIFGLVKILKKIRFLKILAFFIGCSTIFYSHKKYDKDPDIWKYVKNCCYELKDKWVYTKYGTEESFLPAFGIPAYMSHYLITQIYEIKQLAKEKEFGIVFLREDDNNPKVREVVNKYGILIKEFPKVKVYKLRKSVKGRNILM